MKKTVFKVIENGHFTGGSNRIRTCDPLLVRQML